MNIELDTEIKLEEKETAYMIVSYHRNSSLPSKSKWTISREEELNCFISSEEKEWLINHEGWGLIANDSQLLELGRNSNSEPLFISKFIDSDKKDVWHGYPADYRRNTQDIPSITILKKWQADGHIKRHQILKIKRGKQCNL